MSEGSWQVGQMSSDGQWRWDGIAWQPTSAGKVYRPLPRWLSVELRTSATWLSLAAAVLVGLTADQALRAGSFGLAASLAIIFTGLALLFAARLIAPEARVLVAAAVLFAAWLTVRSSP